LFYPIDPNTYAIIIAVIGSYIGLTSITFSAAKSATDTDKKIVFSEIGERFLYSTVLLMFLLILRFMCLDVLHYNLFLLIYDPKTSPPDIATGNEIIAIFLNVVGYILGFILILFTWVGLEKMFKYIFKAFKKDYWERLR
jgi:hypothetical protein